MSNTIKTFRRFVNDLKKIYKEHKQINDFGFGFVEDITFKKEGEDKVNYPYLYVIPSVTNVDEQELKYTLTLVMMDRVINYTDENLLDTLSDTNQILQDVISQFKYSFTPQDGNYTDVYDIELPITLQPFADKYDDYVAGYSCDITIVLAQPLNRCIAPFNNFND
jgi:hypothetical protein